MKLQWKLGRDGALMFVYGSVTVASAPHPLEMETRGRTHRASLFAAGPNALGGILKDDAGAFLSCRVTFRLSGSGERAWIEETRTYRALRDIPEALLTVRYHLKDLPPAGKGFLVIPSLWYGDNEAWNGRIDYPKGLERDWGFLADGSSCPGVVWTGRRSSYAVVTDDSADFPVPKPGLDDVLGIGFADMSKRPPRGRPQAVFTFPAQQVPKSYLRARRLRERVTPRLSWREGQRLTLVFRHYAGAPRLDFHARVWRARFDRVPEAVRHKVSRARLMRTAGLFTRCLKNEHFRPGKGFSHRHDIPEIFSGWCGGFAAAYAALCWGDLAKDGAFRRMGETMCDYLCREGLMPSGFFYSENSQGVWLERVFWAKSDGLNMRNPSEGSCYLALILERERRQGRDHPTWDHALRSNLDAILRTQREDGAFPHEVNGRTGRPVSWVGATSGTWIGALAVVARLDPDRGRAASYLQAARRAARYYLRCYVEKERYIGGPYDTYMAPNMEDPYNLLLAYMELHETTGERAWLAAAKRVADHLLSWRYLYDVRFPDRTVCRRLRVKTFHMSPASVANKHIQNWDTLADAYLFRLSGRLKDPLYADCALQHLAASTQLVQDGRLPKGIPRGGQSEQWYATDFNWFGDCGDYGKGNLWQITVALPKAGFLISMAEWLKKG